MILEQMTMFRVRGERVRISKDAPIAKYPTRAETMWWKCLACGHKWRDLRVCGPVSRSGCPECRSPRIMDCNVGSAEPSQALPGPCGRGGATLIGLAVMTAVWVLLLTLALGGLRIRIVRETVYPDPVCERCGRILDGTSAECAEEGTEK